MFMQISFATDISSGKADLAFYVSIFMGSRQNGDYQWMYEKL
jgi:hypothetical protein